MKSRSIMILIGVILWCDVHAQDHDLVMRRIDSVTNLKATNNPDLVFESYLINVGEISEDDAPKTFYFEFTNSGKSPVVITRASSSCGCILAKYDTKAVAPGARGRVAVTFKPKGHPGALSRNVFVYTDATSNPSAKLTIRGNVSPSSDLWSGFKAVLGPSLKARNNCFYFREMTVNQTRTERIECVNTGTVPLRLIAIPETLPEFVTFRTEPETVEPGKTADILITVNGSKLKSITGQTSAGRSKIVLGNADNNGQVYSLYIETGLKTE